MRAYYNEFDPKAAAWLRELIKAQLIMDGDVDERSIIDVSPNDLKGYTRHHFFCWNRRMGKSFADCKVASRQTSLYSKFAMPAF